MSAVQRSDEEIEQGERDRSYPRPDAHRAGDRGFCLHPRDWMGGGATSGPVWIDQRLSAGVEVSAVWAYFAEGMTWNERCLIDPGFT